MNLKFKKTITYGMVIVFFNMLNPVRKNAVINLYSNENNDANKDEYEDSSIYENIIKFEKACMEKKRRLNFYSDESARLSDMGYKYYTEGDTQKRPVFDFKAGNLYGDIPGVTCFRGSNMRDGGSFGSVEVVSGKLEKVWEKSIGGIDSWTGVGWNGQPAIVRWEESVKEAMNIIPSKKEENNLTEVIYAALDGNVYFMDLKDGTSTREPLSIGAPVKGSLTLDPRGIPLLYVGQGIDTNGGRKVSFAYRIFSLTDFKKLYEIKGNDSFAKRDWGAFDSTALIDKNNDYLFICGENGIFYSGKLNTQYKDGNINISPELCKYRYDTSLGYRRGIENSIALHSNYGFFADNDGVLQCVELQSLQPVWARSVNDDTDSTIVLEEEKRGLSLYTACEDDFQGSGGYSYVRKINALSGKILWENKYKCWYNEDVNGGALATPVSGKGNISDLVIFNIARTPEYNEGRLIAFDKKTGSEVWNTRLENYCWSSPVALYDAEGKGYIVQCDSAGNVFLIDGMNGRVMDKINLGSNVEGTPAAFDNMLVVGTRGGKIIGFKIN